MADSKSLGCAACKALGLDIDKAYSVVCEHLKFSEPTDEDMITKLSFGKAVALGVRCLECPIEHYCDAICFRFKPRIYQCSGCQLWQKHASMKTLITRYRAGLGFND